MFYRVCILGVQNFTRNAWLSLAATLVIILAMSFIISGVMLNITSRNMIAYLSQNLKISVYLEHETNLGILNELKFEFETHPDVVSVEYISHEEAKEKFSQRNNELEIEQAIALVGDPVFPQSLEVSVSDLNKMDEVARIAQSDKYENDVQSLTLGKTDARTTLEHARAIQDTLMRTSIIFVIVFACVAFLIIFNTIRMALFSRREEVQIMRLVGASSRYIRWPFIIDAGLYGFFGGLLAASLIYGLIWFFSTEILATNELVTSYDFFVKNKLVVGAIFLGSIVVGVLLSVLSCLFALQRHLRF